MGMDGSPTGDFAVVANDGSSPGSVQFYSPDLATATELEQTGLEPGHRVRARRHAVPEQRRGRHDRAVRDRRRLGSPVQIGSSPGKGLSYLTGENLLASCDVGRRGRDGRSEAVLAGRHRRGGGAGRDGRSAGTVLGHLLVGGRRAAVRGADRRHARHIRRVLGGRSTTMTTTIPR